MATLKEFSNVFLFFAMLPLEENRRILPIVEDRRILNQPQQNKIIKIANTKRRKIR